jgi:hypothetical protein
MYALQILDKCDYDTSQMILKYLLIKEIKKMNKKYQYNI